MKNNIKNIIEWDFIIPSFFKEDKFKINTDLISNKETINKNRNEYNKTNNEEVNKKRRTYRKNNNTSINKKRREKYHINKQEFNKKRNIYTQDRKQKDPIFKLLLALRNAIHNSITTNNFKKNKKLITILGKDVNDFKLYIESIWEPWMNWENYGKFNGKIYSTWNLDHIIPSSQAKTLKEAESLNHYSNFQPLCSYINSVIKKERLDWDKNNPFN